ncbi:MAG TPA: hypothetical protein VLX67_03125 [Stellaceae bacterium]|nr:hypothetical protein [Stellaceae bacterium]
MNKLSLAVQLAAALTMLALTACSSEPWTLSQSPNQITLRWWSDEVADARANSVAGVYCEQMGKPAELHSIERDGSAAIGRYRCG